MATFIKILKDSSGNFIMPRTRSTAVTMEDDVTLLEDAIDAKASLTSPTFTGTVVLPSTTSIGNVSNTELGYVDGVTSAIQTQFNEKSPLASPTFTGTVTTDIINITNQTSIMEVLETANLIGTAYSTTPTVTNLDLKTGGIFYNTAAATGNVLLNIRGDSTTTASDVIGVGKSMTFTVLITQTGTPFYISGYTIDGASVTPKWFGTAPSSGNANSIDSYTLTIIKTAATPTYTVLASRTKFA